MNTTIKFRHQVISRTQVKNRILKVLDMATPEQRAFDWYADANQFAAKISPNINIGCGVIAALSPRKNWMANKAMAADLMQGRKVGHMRALVAKAERVKQSSGTHGEILDILSGPKISAFYQNLVLDGHHVTIDRHALAIAIWETGEFAMTPNQYQWFADCYRWTAKKIGMRPSLLQAITWEVWREKKKEIFA
jgi:hypothetical protein